MKNIKISFFRTSKGFIEQGIVHISSSVDKMLALEFYCSETEGFCIELRGEIIKPECPLDDTYYSRLTSLGIDIRLPEWFKGSTVGENEIEIDPIVFSRWMFNEIYPKWGAYYLKMAQHHLKYSCSNRANLMLEKNNYLDYFWENYRASVRMNSLFAWVSDEVLCMDRKEFWDKV